MEFETLVTRTEKNNVNVKKYIPKRAYSSLQGLASPKIKDLKTLCKKNIIPAKYHNYYSSFPEKTSANQNCITSDEENSDE